MSFDVYFDTTGGLWVEPVEDQNTIQFNFIKVESGSEYLAIIKLLKAKQRKRYTILKKVVKTKLSLFS